MGIEPLICGPYQIPIELRFSGVSVSRMTILERNRRLALTRIATRSDLSRKRERWTGAADNLPSFILGGSATGRWQTHEESSRLRAV